eukprot:758307-Hanusia_phi.AAC.2
MRTVQNLGTGSTGRRNRLRKGSFEEPATAKSEQGVADKRTADPTDDSNQNVEQMRRRLVSGKEKIITARVSDTTIIINAIRSCSPPSVQIRTRRLGPRQCQFLSDDAFSLRGQGHI